MSAIKKNSGKEKIKIISALWNCFRKYHFFLKGVATNKQKRINKPNFKLIYLKTNLVKSEKCENKRKYLT